MFVMYFTLFGKPIPYFYQPLLFTSLQFIIHTNIIYEVSHMSTLYTELDNRGAFPTW